MVLVQWVTWVFKPWKNQQKASSHPELREESEGIYSKNILAKKKSAFTFIEKYQHIFKILLQTFKMFLQLSPILEEAWWLETISTQILLTCLLLPDSSYAYDIIRYRKSSKKGWNTWYITHFDNFLHLYLFVI